MAGRLTAITWILAREQRRLRYHRSLNKGYGPCAAGGRHSCSELGPTGPMPGLPKHPESTQGLTLGQPT